MRIFLKLWLFVLPLPLYFGIYFYMKNTGHESSKLFTVFAVPVVYGYLIPYISTTVMKKWEFFGGIKFGGIYIHQGFKIASHLVLWLFLLTILMPVNEVTILQSLIAATFGGIAQSLTVWIHDIWAIKYGFLKMNNKAFLSGNPAEVITFKFAPLTFFTLGFIYTFTSLLILKGYVFINIQITGILSFIFLVGVVSIVYKYCECLLEA